MRKVKKFKVRLGDGAMESLWNSVDDFGKVSAAINDEDGSVTVGNVRFTDLSAIANVEAEASLLGALMIANNLVDEVPHLLPEHFYGKVEGEIYAKIRELVAAGKNANPVTLKPYFDEHEGLAQVGGASYLAQLTGSGAAVIGARDMAEQIIDLFEMRSIRATLLKAVGRCEDTSDEIEPYGIVADLEAELADAMVADKRKASVSVGDAAKEAAKAIEETAAGKEPAGFLLHGFEDWNHVRGRMEGGDFDLLGARPSMGKTAVSLRIARAAAEGGIATEYLSLEMKREKIVRRILADMIYRQGESCTYEQLAAGHLGKEDWRALSEAQEKLGKLPLFISDDKLFVEDLGPFLRKRKRWYASKGLELKFVIVDYLGQLQTRRNFNSETELTAHISRTLKTLARELDIAILALAQLNRGLEARDDKRPRLADLRYSGSLEQDADNVLFIYRDEYYLEKVEPERSKTEKWEKWADEINRVRDDLEIYASKRREGALSKRIAKFYTRYQAVRDHGDFAHAPSFFDDPAENGVAEVRG